MSSNPLSDLVEEQESKFFQLFNQSGGRLSYEIKSGEKGEFLEVKVLNEEAKLAGIAWFFGMKRAYIEDVRLLVARKESQGANMVLVALDGTTSAGKKLLREAKIPIIKSLDEIKSAPKKKKKTKKQADKVEEEFSVDDDVNIADYADSPLIKIAERLIKRREPEFINVRHAKGFEDETNDVIGLSSRKAILAYYRTVETDSVGVKFVRQFLTTVENFENIPIGIIGRDKFTPSAKKEATERNIILVSEREIKETKGTEELQKLNDRLIEGAREILIQRNFEIVTKTTPEFMKLIAGSQSLGTYILAENKKKVAENKKKEAIIVLIPFEEVVRVATVREFHDQMLDLEITEGMLIPLNRFTYTAEREARNFSIAVLRKNHPVFNIFSHGLVPEHQILTRNEIDEILVHYNAQISNLPKLFEDDPAAIAVNAQIGDVVRILRSHDNFMYRLVIPRVEAGVTAESVMADLMVDRRKRLGKKK